MKKTAKKMTPRAWAEATLKKTAKKKPAAFTREVTAQAAYLATRCAIAEMSTREMKEMMRTRKVPIPKLRKDMIDRLANHFGETGAKVVVTIG